MTGVVCGGDYSTDLPLFFGKEPSYGLRELTSVPVFPTGGGSGVGSGSGTQTTVGTSRRSGSATTTWART